MDILSGESMNATPISADIDPEDSLMVGLFRSFHEKSKVINDENRVSLEMIYWRRCYSRIHESIQNSPLRRLYS